MEFIIMEEHKKVIKELEVKKLEWRDNITSFGKEQGLFEILSDVEEINLSYHIRNYKFTNSKVEENKFYFIFAKDNLVEEYSSIEDAKQRAQEHFKKTIYQMFFLIK